MDNLTRRMIEIDEYLDTSSCNQPDEKHLIKLDNITGSNLPSEYRQYLLYCDGAMPIKRVAISSDKKIKTIVHGMYELNSESGSDIFTALDSRPMLLKTGHIPFAYDDGGAQFLLHLRTGEIRFADYDTDEYVSFGTSFFDFIKSLRDPLKAVNIEYYIESQLLSELGDAIDQMDDPNGSTDEVGNSAVIVAVYCNKPDVYKYLVYDKKLKIGRSLEVLKTNQKYSDKFDEMENVVRQSIEDFGSS